jgi:surface antigen
MTNPEQMPGVGQNSLNTTKKLLAKVVLATTLLTSALTGVPEASAEAEGYPDYNMKCVAFGDDDYGYSQNQGPNETVWCSGYQFGTATDNQNSSRGYGYRNCTDYAAWYVEKELDIDMSGLGHATAWNNNAANKGLRVRSASEMPEVGDIAHWEGNDADPTQGYGHVAIVTKVYANGNVDTGDFNGMADGNYSVRTNVNPDNFIDPVPDSDINSSTGGTSTSTARPGTRLNNMGDILDTGSVYGWRGWNRETNRWTYDFLDIGTRKGSLLVGDFDNDGHIDDILDTPGNKEIGWRLSKNGKNDWDGSFLNTSRTADSLLVGDFDNDGFMDDVFDATRDERYYWRVSINGKDGWRYDYKNSTRTADTLMVGDFDQDGYMDDIMDFGSEYGFRMSRNGKEPFDDKNYLQSTRGREHMFVGDFDEDGYMDDILDTGSSKGWRVSIDGHDEWDYSYRNSTMPASMLAVGDFDGDGFIDDVLYASGQEEGIRYSADGTGDWQHYARTTRTMGTILIGDFFH